MAAVFFPLDRELGLLPKKRYTPQIQACMTRLGAKLPFAEAAEEVKYAHRVNVSEKTTRITTHENGKVAVAIVEKEVARLKATSPKPENTPKTLQISTDGCFICTTTGEWREIKTVAIGECEPKWDAKKSKVVPETNAWSYYSSCAKIREFEEGALLELHKRGVENAETVVAVNDGAKWIDSFTDYHCPDAIRILDLSHAAEHVAEAGRVALGENTDRFQKWYDDATDRLKHKPPAQTIARLHLLQDLVENENDREKIINETDYLERRLDQIDYQYFQSRHLPIGSGSVESANKHVVQKRMKQAGMRWSPEHLDPMLALRNLISNDRWAEGWQEMRGFQLNALNKVRDLSVTIEPVPPPITLNSVKVLPDKPVASVEQPKTPYKPAPEHPWRRPFIPQRH